MRRPQPIAPAAASPLLTLQQAAVLLSVSLRQLQTWRAAGRLKVLAFGRRCIRVEPAEIERFKNGARS